MKKISFLLPLLLCALLIQAQDDNADSPFVFQTFKSTRIVNMHSTETLPKNVLDIRIAHKFGDAAGDNGGWSNFFGLENAADVSIGAEYGITNDITIGLARVKGSQGLFQNLAGTAKYRFLKQKKEGGSPLTMTFVGLASFSTQKKVDNPEAIQFFDKFAHRLAYSGQVIIARKFGERFSMQVSPGYVHRNIVFPGDSNGIFYVAAGARLQISKVFGIIADANIPFSDIRTRDNNYYPAIGVGIEMETGGHIFQVNFTNATGLLETDYIPYTRSSWAEGQFRISFGISRHFNL